MAGKVLIVDNSQYLRRNLVAILEAEGYTVQQTSSAGEAFQAAQQSLVLIVLGESLPDMPSPELLKCLKASSRAAEVPVVLLTSSVSEAKRQALVDEGAINVFETPVERERLMAYVKAFLKDTLNPGRDVTLSAPGLRRPVSARVLRLIGDRRFVLVLPPEAASLKPWIAGRKPLELSYRGAGNLTYRVQVVFGAAFGGNETWREAQLQGGLYRTRRRKLERKLVRLPVRYVLADGTGFMAESIDIAGSGMRLAGVLKSIEAGEQIKLHFQLPGDDQIFNVGARVVKALPSSAGGAEVELAFELVDLGRQLALLGFVHGEHAPAGPHLLG